MVKPCVNTQTHTLAHHGPLIHWLMAPFSTIHLSCHPSLVSRSSFVLPTAHSLCPHFLFFFKVRTSKVVATQQWHCFICILNCYIKLSSLLYSHFFSPNVLTPQKIPYFLSPALLLAGQLTDVFKDSFSVVWVCTTNLSYVNLRLAIHRGL